MDVGYAVLPQSWFARVPWPEDLVSLLVHPCTYKGQTQKCPGLEQFTVVQVEIPMGSHSQVDKVFAVDEESAG